MFATLLGTLPRPPLPADASAEALVQAAVDAQVRADLEPVTDGGWWAERSAVDAWRVTSRLTDRAVKQVLIGPYSAMRVDPSGTSGPSTDRAAAVLAAARAANLVLRGLAEAGCPLVEIHEPAIVGIGTDRAEWSLFRETQLILTYGLEGMHMSLAITGGSADATGVESILAAPYASLAVDLIAGPDNWRLVRAVPGALGIVCGALSPVSGTDDGPETLLWAAAYAASVDGRGPDRVGLATSASLGDLPWGVAIAKLDRLAEAVRLARLAPGELRTRLDPRAVDIRSAALGHADPAPTPAARRPPADERPT